jgi:hypothetical protein
MLWKVVVPKTSYKVIRDMLNGLCNEIWRGFPVVEKITGMKDCTIVLLLEVRDEVQLSPLCFLIVVKATDGDVFTQVDVST